MTKIRSKIQFNPQRLEDARKTSGKKRSYRSIAEEIDVNERTIRKSCKDGLITPELLDKLARALNIDTAYLMGEFDLFYDQLNDEEIRRKYKEIDNKHLNENGIRYFCALSKEFVLITTNTRHPAFNVEDENLHIIYQNELSLKDALIKLKSEYGCERITIQTGGTLNNLFLREKLFDYVDIIIAPVLIGGKDTSTLIDGKSLTEECELSKLGVVKLQECVVLENSYLRLRYEVIH